MFTSKTVFVIGAGASKEAGLPIGVELAKKIAGSVRVRGDTGFADVLENATVHQAIIQKQREAVKPPNHYFDACRLISSGIMLAPSVDNFLDAHKDNEAVNLCGKLSIVASILKAEQTSKLHFDSSNMYNKVNLERINDTWYVAFWRRLCTGINRENVKDIFNNTAFIVFNYDRCFEQFLLDALRRYYDLDESTAKEILSKAKIYHPYGMVGQLPSLSDSLPIPYGHEPSPQNLLEIPQQIKTFTERLDDTIALNELRNQIASAEKIVFLGFAFHESNMQLIKPNTMTKARYLFGTCLGFSDSDAEVIANSIRDILREDKGQMDRLSELRASEIENLEVKLINGTCRKLFDEFSSSLS